MNDNTISLYKAAIQEWDLLIHAQKEKLRMITSKYDGEVTEEVEEVLGVLRAMEQSRAVESSRLAQATSKLTEGSLMFRIEDDEL